MYLIQGRNAQQIYPVLSNLIRERGPSPVTVLYERPDESVLFYPERDVNPFFSFFEALWALSGRDDAWWLAQFDPRAGERAEDDGRIHGALGARLRKHFGKDQIERAVARLRAGFPEAEISVWDAAVDFEAEKRNLPHTIGLRFSRKDDQLDLTAFNWSNYLMWDGLNCFPVLQEYIAARAGLALGRLWQVSASYHGEDAPPVAPMENLYERGEVFAFPLVRDPARWDSDFAMFMSEGARAIGYQEPFFRRVAVPLLRAWEALRTDSPQRHLDAVGEITACMAADVRRAGREWLLRKRDRWIKTKD